MSTPTDATGGESEAFGPPAGAAAGGADPAGAGPDAAAPARTRQPGIGPAQDHGRASLISLAVAVVATALSAGLVALLGVPRETSEPSFVLGATLLGFGFCGGQAAMVTGFMAMKQRQNPLYVVVAIAGLLLGVLGFVAIFGLSMWIAAQRSGLVR